MKAYVKKIECETARYIQKPINPNCPICKGTGKELVSNHWLDCRCTYTFERKKEIFYAAVEPTENGGVRFDFQEAKETL